MHVEAYDKQLMFIAYISWQKAVKSLFLNKAKAITTYGEWLFLEDWLKYNSNGRYINTINGKFPIP